VIVGTAVRAVQQMYRPGFNYAKAGVMLVDLRPPGQHAG
jgi:DNA polymerase V